MKCRHWEMPLDDSRAWMGTCDIDNGDCHIRTAEDKHKHCSRKIRKPKPKVKRIKVKFYPQSMFRSWLDAKSYTDRPGDTYYQWRTVQRKGWFVCERRLLK